MLLVAMNTHIEEFFRTRIFFFTMKDGVSGVPKFILFFRIHIFVTLIEFVSEKEREKSLFLILFTYYSFFVKRIFR